MCRIDSAYTRFSFEEKSTPKERLAQAFDEYSYPDSFKMLFCKHFGENWPQVFGGISVIENALDSCKSYDNDLEKLAALIRSTNLDLKLQDEFVANLAGYFLNEQTRARGFFIDIAKSFFPESPYGLYSSKLGSCFKFKFPIVVHFIYEEYNSFQESFFTDPAWITLSSEDRLRELWSYLCFLVNGKNSQFTDRLEFSREDVLAFFGASPEKEVQSDFPERFSKGFNFLKSWIESDAKQGRIKSKYDEPFSKICNLLYGFFDFLKDNEHKDQFYSWKREIEKSLELTLLTNINVETATEFERIGWVKCLDDHFEHYVSHVDYGSDSEKGNDVYLTNQYLYFNDLIERLSPVQREIWLKYSIEEYLTPEKIIGGRPDRVLEKMSKWCFGATYEEWKKSFSSSIQGLSFEEKLNVFSRDYPIPHFVTRKNTDDINAFKRSHESWWDELFFELVRAPEFPKLLLPKWTLESRNKAGNSNDMLPFADKSIGFLRGELAEASCSENELSCYQDQLAKLLDWIAGVAPQKAIRHRLLLMRSSRVPLADESLSYRQGQADCLWYYPLTELGKRLSNNRHVYNAYAYSNDAWLNCYTDLSKVVAEFCLSRLKLSKGEKIIDGQYEVSQLIEKSAIWRQGYLKALAEIGFDLGGEAHKTVFFVSKSDPSLDVRAIAKETYKAVRRKTSPTKSVQDLKRGLIAAEWWLLHCQRQELELDINHQSAINTRRQLLRNP